MSQDYFRAYFDGPASPWSERLIATVLFYLACGLFQAYPLPRQMSGTRRALKYTGELVSASLCPLVFPEGSRSTGALLQPFQSGIGLMALRLRAPVVPVHIRGTSAMMPPEAGLPEPGRVTVRFGPALDLRHSSDPAAAAQQVEIAVHRLAHLGS
jgi:1-acyl-sn-glycerol-3-phosphate acyltransferase